MNEPHFKGIRYINRGVCPLCDSIEQEIYIAFPEIPINRCMNCNFIFSARLMSDKDLDIYYRQGFGSDRHLQGQLINAKINIRALRILLGNKNINTFLDVGTGYGFLLKEVEDTYGISATGVELSKLEVHYGIHQLGAKILNCSLKESGLKPHSFDVITCFEVIEHIRNPHNFIDELLFYLKPEGYIVVMTDNFESSVVKDLGVGFPKWIPHSHISHFAPKTLHKLLVDKGLVIEKKISYTPWELIVRNLYYKFHGIKKLPEQEFDLTSILESEMRGTYQLFWLRRIINILWARYSVRNDLEGALMYVSAKRQL